MTQTAELGRTPIVGIFLGYVVSCFLATTWLSAALFFEQSHVPSATEMVGAIYTFSVFALVFCALPFGLGRFIISRLRAKRLWHYALLGASTGTVIGWAVITDWAVSLKALSFVLYAFSMPGLVIGLVDFAIEAFFLRLL